VLAPLFFGWIYADTLPDVYQSKATVLLSGEQENSSIASLIPGASSAVDFDTSIFLLKSHRFLDLVVSKLSIPTSLTNNQQEPSWGAGDIDKNLSISQIPRTNLLEISFDSIAPKFSAQLVNAITANFAEYQAQLLQPNVKK